MIETERYRSQIETMTDEETEKSDIEKEAYQDTIEILQSIVKNGLLPPLAQEKKTTTSDTPSEQSTIVGNLLNPTLECQYDASKEHVIFRLKELNNRIVLDRTLDDHGIFEPDDFYRSFQDFKQGKNTPSAKLAKQYAVNWEASLYHGRSAVLPVVAERPWIKPSTMYKDKGNTFYENLTEEDIEQSIMQSIVCVADFDNIKNDSLLNLTNLEYEYRAIDRVPFDRIEVIIAPSSLKPLIQKAIPDPRIQEKFRFVDMTSKEICVYKFCKRMNAPDYETALEQYMYAHPDKKLWIHGVRLTTAQDVSIKRRLSDD